MFVLKLSGYKDFCTPESFNTNILRLKIPYTQPKTKDKYLEFLFLDKNQLDEKIVWGLAEGFPSSHSSFICYSFSLPDTQHEFLTLHNHLLHSPTKSESKI